MPPTSDLSDLLPDRHLAAWRRSETSHISREIIPGRPHRLHRHAFSHFGSPPREQGSASACPSLLRYALPRATRFRSSFQYSMTPILQSPATFLRQPSSRKKVFYFASGFFSPFLPPI